MGRLNKWRLGLLSRLSQGDPIADTADNGTIVSNGNDVPSPRSANQQLDNPACFTPNKLAAHRSANKNSERLSDCHAPSLRSSGETVFVKHVLGDPGYTRQLERDHRHQGASGVRRSKCRYRS